MKLTFLGAAETVTGSKYLLETSSEKYLVDCGLFQGKKELRVKNWELLPVEASSIKAVVLTHAHLDHSGYLPILVKNGFKGPIYASHGTCDLCKIILLDSGRIQEEDAMRANKYGYSKHKPALPLYTERDAEKCLKQLHPLEYGASISLNDNLTFTLERSGHILGSSFVIFKKNDASLVFSGDLGRPHDPLMKNPVKIVEADYLVLESTYGNKKHPQVDAALQISKEINEALRRGGSIVIPSFAIGRAQTLLYYVHKLKMENKIPQNIPVYIDSPMSEKATKLWCKYSAEHGISKEECESIIASAHYVETQEDSKNINRSNTPSIIISASGMAEGGRVLHHIKFYGPHPENSIIFAGFQAEGTRGDLILKGDELIKIHGQEIPIRAYVSNLEMLSSHADYEETLEWLKNLKKPPKEIFITHGEIEAAESLKEKIENTYGWKVIVPAYLQSFELPEFRG